MIAPVIGLEGEVFVGQEQQGLGASATPSGSREPDPSCTGSGPTGFDPSRAGSWIEWKGGACPVHPETMIDVLWNNRAVTRNSRAATFCASDGFPHDLWSGPQSGGYIIAYRLAAIGPPSIYEEGMDTRLLFRVEETDRGFFAVREESPRFVFFGETLRKAIEQAEAAIAMEVRSEQSERAGA